MSLQHKQADLNKRSLNKQCGIVIVVALFIVGLVATLSYVMMTRLERDTYRTRLILRGTEGYFYAQGSIAWAQDQLRTDYEKQKANKIVDAIPIKSGVIDVNGYKIKSTIHDMQSRFNINNITTAEGQKSFQLLLKAVAPQLSEAKQRELLRAVIDWVTPASKEEELEKYYANLPTPYRAAHRIMMDVNELRLVKGMTPKLFIQLRPFVSALPMGTKINVQNAPTVVLMSLSPKITLDVAKEIEKYRAEKPIVSMQQFLAIEILKKNGLAAGDITQAIEISDYFLVETEVAIETQHIVLYTLLERATKGNLPAVTVLWQSKGAW